MILLLPLAQVQPTHSTADLLTLAVVGIAVVFVALSLIGLVLAGLDRLLRTAEPKPEPVPVPRSAEGLHGPPTALQTDGAQGALTPQMLAVVSAAAYAAVGRPVQIRRVTFVRPTTTSAWQGVGRATIQASHNFKR